MVKKAVYIRVDMFKFIVLSGVIWLTLYLTPFGDILEKQVNSLAVKRVEQINKNSEHSKVPKLPSTKPLKRGKW